MQTSTYPPQTLLEKWKKGEMTAEMAVGHLVQHLLDHEARLQVLEKQLNQQRGDE